MIFGFFGKKRASGSGTPPQDPAAISSAASPAKEHAEPVSAPEGDGTPLAARETPPADFPPAGAFKTEAAAPDSPTENTPFALIPGAPALRLDAADDEDGFLSRLASGSAKFTEDLAAWFTKRKAGKDALDGLESLLLQADLGPAAAARVCEALRAERFPPDASPDIFRAALAAELERMMAPLERPLMTDPARKPYVALFCGVNGSGKTTTIGKMAAHAVRSGKKVVVAACDTFRAGAEEQLEIWAERAGAIVVRGAPGADPASVAYRAVEIARQEGADLLLVDTAGRLQNKHNLMEELKKIIRVLGKADPQAPDARVLVLDAGGGQNTLKQIELFSEAAGVTGLIMTKMDGTAKGGALVAGALEYRLPVYGLGAGEKAEDLRAFSASAFAGALAGTAFKKEVTK